MEVLTSEKSDCVYSFESFEVSSLANTLYKGGEPVRIQYLPLQLLLTLLERAGQMVTKEELRDRLWGTDTFVEVDQNLYVIVSKLRELLDDTARQPRFIQTVSGRGYRFIGTVTQRKPVSTPEIEPVSRAPDLNPGKPLLDAPAPQPSTAPERAQTLSTSARHARLALSLALLSGLVLLGLGVAGIFTYRSRHQQIYKPHDQIFIGGILNETAKPELTQTLGFAVQLKFQESPTFDLVPAQRARQLINNPNEADRDAQLHACSLLGSQLLINGRLQSSSHGYEIQLMTSRCSDGKLLATESAQADSDASILSAVDVVTDKMRRRLGESDATLQRFDMPLTQATTKSLAALEAFTQGEDKLKLGNALAAVPSYKLAIDLDPQFALAYARLGTIYLNAQEQSIGAGYYQKAFQLRDRTTDRERLYIAAHYYTDVTGEYPRAIDTYQLWRNLYPNDWGAANNLANLYDMLGRPQDALRYVNQALQINPSSTLANVTLAQAYMTSGQYAPLNAICNREAAMNNPMIALHNICFLGALAQNNEHNMQREMQWAHGNPQESVLLESAALAALFHGRVNDARTLFSRARESARLNHLPEMISVVDVDQSNAEAELGFSAPAREMANNAVHNTPQYDKAQDVDTLAGTALTLAIAGSGDPALHIVNQAVQQAPLNSILNDLEVPTIRAVVAVKQHNPRLALDILAPTTPLEFYVQSKFIPIYYRGLADMQLKQWKEAETQFNKILEHRSIIPGSLYIGLAQMQLGLALQHDGQESEARKDYDAAALLWKNADPDFAPSRELAAYQKSLKQ